MGAEFGAEVNVFRLIKPSDQIARLQYRAQHCRRIARIGAQIAIAQIMRGKQRRAAGKIEYEIAARRRAIAGSLEEEGVARGGAGRRVVVDGKLEGAEMA